MGRWLWRGVRWLARRWRPEGGWVLWLLAAGAVLWPAGALLATEWVRRHEAPLLSTPTLSFILVWWLWQRVPSRARPILAVGFLYPVLLTTVARVWPAWPLWVNAIRETTLWLLLGGETSGVEAAWAAWTAVFLWRWEGFHQAMVLWARLAWTGNVNSGQFALVTLFSGGLYFLAWWVVWAVRQRRDGLLAAMPGVALCAWNAYLAGRSLWWLVGSLSLAVILATLTHYHRLEQNWRRRRVDYSDQIQLDFGLVGLTLAALVFVTSPVLPVILSPRLHAQVREIVQGPWQRVEAGAARLFPDVSRPSPGTAPLPVPASLPRAHKLGAGPDLLDREVMQVRPEGLPWPEGIYWFGRAYDVYTGQGWVISPWQPRPLTAGVAWVTPDTRTRRLVSHMVQFAGPVGDVYAAGMPIAVDRPARMLMYTSEAWVGMELDTPVRRYTVLAAVPAWSEAILRRGGTTYPDAIRRQYLQLPEEIPERVRTLAREITRNARTPYEKARAIEAYLRQIPYSLDVPTPPSDRDLVDWFLFDLQLGYCDYYATAFVVLARLNGLPTRFVIGYAQGTWDPQAQVYRVTERDAHSWPEVYFPGVGWVPFEPTAIRTVPRWSSPSPTASSALRQDTTALQRFRAWARARWRTEVASTWARRLGISLLSLMFIAGGGVLLWMRRLPAAARGYRAFLSLGRVLGVPHMPFQTPREYAGQVLARLTRSPRWLYQRVCPWAVAVVERYQTWRYGPESRR